MGQKLNQNSSAVICLSHQLDENNNLSIDSINRIKKSVDVFKEQKSSYLITTGWAYTSSIDKPLSSIMADYAVQNLKISRKYLFEEPNPKDTVGEAYFLKKNFCYQHKQIKNLYIVTSDWHLERAKEIFEFIFSNKNDQIIHFITILGDKKFKVQELSNNSITKFREMTKSCKRGDLEEIYSKMRIYHSLYKDN